MELWAVPGAATSFRFSLEFRGGIPGTVYLVHTPPEQGAVLPLLHPPSEGDRPEGGTGCRYPRPGCGIHHLDDQQRGMPKAAPPDSARRTALRAQARASRSVAQSSAAKIIAWVPGRCGRNKIGDVPRYSPPTTLRPGRTDEGQSETPVPLPRAVLAVPAAAPRAGGNPYEFPGWTSGRTGRYSGVGLACGVRR